jgi:hypothetical protein
MRTNAFAMLFAAGSLLLSACATAPREGAVPPDALTVASVRHTSAPQPAPVWVSRADLPSGSLRSDDARALLLEVAVHEGQVRSVESAPLELANLRVRIDARDRRQTVVALENDSVVALDFELFLSPDGERFRRVPTCPVAAGTTAYERWPEPAPWLAVGAVRAAAGGDERCD